MEQTTLTLSAADFAACLSIRLSQPDVDDRQNLVGKLDQPSDRYCRTEARHFSTALRVFSTC